MLLYIYFFKFLKNLAGGQRNAPKPSKFFWINPHRQRKFRRQWRNQHLKKMSSKRVLNVKRDQNCVRNRTPLLRPLVGSMAKSWFVKFCKIFATYFPCFFSFFFLSSFSSSIFLIVFFRVGGVFTLETLAELVFAASDSHPSSWKGK